MISAISSNAVLGWPRFRRNRMRFADRLVVLLSSRGTDPGRYTRLGLATKSLVAPQQNATRSSNDLSPPIDDQIRRLVDWPAEQIDSPGGSLNDKRVSSHVSASENMFDSGANVRVPTRSLRGSIATAQSDSANWFAEAGIYRTLTTNDPKRLRDGAKRAQTGRRFDVAKPSLANRIRFIMGSSLIGFVPN